MSTFKIKRGDPVVVIQGAFKGTIGTVLKIDLKNNKAYVSGVKPNTKYKKKNVSAGRTTGLMFEVPRPVHISNIMYYEEGKGASRISVKIDSNGVKSRIAKKSGTTLKAPTKNVLITTQAEASEIVDVKPAKKPKAIKEEKATDEKTVTEVKATKTTKKSTK
jgi:large subunit ribosomal protein L24